MVIGGEMQQGRPVVTGRPCCGIRVMYWRVRWEFGFGGGFVSAVRSGRSG